MAAAVIQISGGEERKMLTCSIPQTSIATFLSSSKKHRRWFESIQPRKCWNTRVSLRIGVEEIAEIARNKVLVAATLAAVIGQLSKPFTTSALNPNRGIDLKAAVRSGGMPSTHSAGVVAAATSLGLERGFSDPIFGMSVVFAALVMYDAQGVRREVGYHGKALNTLSSKIFEEKGVSVDSKPGNSSVRSESLTSVLSLAEKANSFTPDQEPLSLGSSEKMTNIPNAVPSNVMVDSYESPENAQDRSRQFNESVGHTEIQVLAGAVLGFLTSLTIETIL